MNMKRIVFAAVGILVMLLIIGWMLHSITHIDEINQKRREKDKGEALASQIIMTTATTSIWDSLRQTETSGTEEGNQEGSENPEMPEENPEETAGYYEEDSAPEEAFPDTAPANQTITEVSPGYIIVQ